MVKASVNRTGGALLIAALCLGAFCAHADTTLSPGDDLVQAVHDAAEGSTIWLKGGSDDPTKYVVDQTLVIDKNLTLRGETAYRPDQIEITGQDENQDCPGNQISDPGFEDIDHTVWTETINPADPSNAGYTIIQEDADHAHSTSHLADFKGIEGSEAQEGMDQTGVIIPTVEGLDEEIWQNVTVPRAEEAIDELSQTIMLPDQGMDDEVYLRRPFRNASSPVNYASAVLKFSVARDTTPPEPEDHLEVSITDGSKTELVPLVRIDAQSFVPNAWHADLALLPLAPLAGFLGQEDTWQLHFKAVTSSGMKFYVDDIRADVSLPSSIIALPQGSFDNGNTSDWNAVTATDMASKIVDDPFPSTGNDKCLALGGSATTNLRLQFKLLAKFGSVPTDQFEVLLDDVPQQMELTSTSLPPAPVIIAGGIPENQYITVQVDLSGETRPSQKLLKFRSKTTPSAASPDAPEANTTVFLVDDVCLMAGTPPVCIQAPQAGAISNGGFDEGPNGIWQEMSSIAGNPMLPLITKNTVYGTTSPPFAARFGGLQPPALTFHYKVHKYSGNGEDYLRAWFDGDDDGPDVADKWMLDTLAEGASTSNAWVLRKRWLLPDVADGNPHKLYFRGTSSRDPEESTFLVDAVCISPFGGFDPCMNNSLADGSFESYPGATNWAEIVKVGGVDRSTTMRVRQCYDPANRSCLAPDVFDGGSVAMFGGLPPASLRFWLQINNREAVGSSELQVLIDGTEVASIEESDTGYFSYREVVIDPEKLSPFADNGPHTLAFTCKAVRRVKPVEFLIDDICLNPWGGLDPEHTGYDCPENTVFDPGFEPPQTVWNQTAVDDAVIIEKNSPAWPSHTGDWLAKLNGGQPDIRRLTQEVNVPTDARTLTFWVWIYAQSGSGTDALQVYVDDTDGSPVAEILENDTKYTGGWAQASASFPNVPAGKHDLIVQSATGRAATPTQFLVDDFCLSPSTMQLKPVIQVEADTIFRIENLAVTGGTIGILGMSDASEITILRCYAHHLANEGIYLNGVSDSAISNSVVYTCGGDAIHVKGGKTNVFQCTLKNNGSYGVYAEGGTVNVIASLVWNNTGGLRSASSTLTSYNNFVYPVDFSSVRFGGDPDIFASPDPDVVHFLDTPWVGKLKNTPPAPCPCPIYADTSLEALNGSGVTYPLDNDSGDRLGNLGSSDFESDPRDDSPLQVGADEVVAGANLAAWTRCAVSTVAPAEVTGRDYDIVIGKTFTVEVEVVGPASLDDANIFVVPQEYQSYVNSDPSLIHALQENLLWGRLSTPSDPRVGVAVFTIGSTCMEHPQEAGQDLCLDGRARIYLEIGGTLYGIGINEDFLTFSPRYTEFIVDTTPPAIAPISLQSTAQTLVLDSNDSLLPSAADGPYPNNWCAQYPPLAVSAGTLTPVVTPPPHVFFNNDPSGGMGASALSFTVGLVFWDTFPVDSHNIEHNLIETSGFRKNLGDLTADGSDAVQNLLFNGPGMSGTAYWKPGGSASAAVSGVDASLLMNQMEPSYGETGLGGDEERAEKMFVLWQVSGLDFNPSWHFTTQFGATDIAGNRMASDEPLHFWWMRDPAAVFTSAPAAGVRTEAPVFGWMLDRGSADTPQDADPCLPIAQFRIWQAENPFAPDVTMWLPVDQMLTEWSDWQPGSTIDVNTLIYDSGLTLGDVLQTHPGSLLMMTLRGADEAGNVQPLPASAAGDVLANLGALAGGGGIPPVAYAYWRSPGQVRPLDTSMQAQFWHNRDDVDIDDPSLRAYDPGMGEKDFGSSRRVPISPEECGLRIEGKFTIRVEIPDAPSAAYTYYVDCQLFQDGQLVVAGILEVPPDQQVLEIQIPQDVINPQAGLTWRFPVGAKPYEFLRESCGRQDRLGDDGNKGDNTIRKRDVEYIFTARTMEEDSVGRGWAADPTPAMVQFTVTVPENRKEEQPIKVFTRE